MVRREDFRIHLVNDTGVTHQVYRLKGREEISRVFDFTIDASVPEDVDPEDLLGTSWVIVFTLDGEVVRRIAGMVAEVEDGFEAPWAATGTVPVRLRLVPRIWRLSLRESCDVYVGESVPDTVQDRMLAAGLTKDDFVLRLAQSYGKREFVVQYKETDLAFISRSCENMGVSFYFVEKGGRDVIVFTDGSNGFDDGGIVRYTAEHGGTQVGVVRFGARTREIPRKFSVRDFNYRTPQVDLLGEATLPVGEDIEVFEYGTHFKTPGEGTYMAGLRAQERLATRKQYHGEGSVTGMRAGTFFTLQDSPVGDVELLVTSVEHEANLAGVAGKDGAGDDVYKNRFTAIAKKTIFRPQRITPKPRVYGVITGMIDAEQDSQYAQLDSQGRYAVRFIFDTSDSAGGHASHRVRMVQPHAGAGYGMHFPLRPGVEVVLTCIDGDPDRPIIAGTVPNPLTQSPVTVGNAQRNVIRTGGGNEINIDDQSGSERIKMTTPHLNTTFQLGAANDPEAGAILSTVGASTTAATSGVSTITSFNAAFNGFWKWSTAGNVSLKAEKPDALAVAAMALSVFDGVTTLASNALTEYQNARKANNAMLAQDQSNDDVATAQAKNTLDDLQNDQTNPGSPDNMAALLAQYQSSATPAPTTSVTVTAQNAANSDNSGIMSVLSASGTPATTTVITITITNAASGLAAGTAAMSYTLDFEGSPVGVVIPSSGSYTIPNLGVTLTFANGVFSVGDSYTVTCVANYITAYSAAQAAIAKDIKTRDTDTDTLYQLQRQNSEDPALKGTLGNSVTLAQQTVFYDNRQVEIDQRNIDLFKQQVATNLASAQAANPQNAALIALLQQMQGEVDAYDTAVDNYASAVGASSRARKAVNDDTFDMANNPDMLYVADTQQAITMEKGVTALISLAMGIYGTVKSFTAKFKANAAWLKLGKSVLAASPRMKPEAAFNFNALRSPMATVSAEHSTQVTASQKLLLTSSFIGMYASRPPPPDPADPVAVAAAVKQQALALTADADATAAETAAKAADKAVKAADAAWDHYIKAKAGILRLDKLVAWMALNTTARAAIKAAEAAADAASLSNSVSETGMMAVGADDHLSLTSKRILEVASGDTVYVTAADKLDVQVSSGPFTLSAYDGSSEVKSEKGALVLQAGPDPSEGPGDASDQFIKGTAVGCISFSSYSADVTLDASKGVASLLSVNGPQTAAVECSSADEKVAITGSKSVLISIEPALPTVTGLVKIELTSSGLNIRAQGTQITSDGMNIGLKAGPSQITIGPTGITLKSGPAQVVLGPSGVQVSGPIIQNG